MKTAKVISPEEAANWINNEDTIVICGCENILLPDTILKASKERYLHTGEPKNLTEIHPIIVGMGPEKGLENLAQKGMVKRAIGSGYSYLKTSVYTKLLRENSFEAHVAPMGTLFQIFKDIAAGRKFTITQVGLNTFVDPSVEGGIINEVVNEPISSIIKINDEPHLLYPHPDLDIAILRGTTADEHGNISLEDEPVTLGVKTLAMAVKNSGGKVIVQVRRLTQGGHIHPRMVEIPGIFVDAVVVDPNQSVSGGAEINPALTGEIRLPIENIDVLPESIKKIIVSRAVKEIEENNVVNLGVGVPVDVPRILVEQHEGGKAIFFPEHGSIGGIPGERSIFGTNINPWAIIDSTNVFDFYLGGGLDISFLGFAEIDRSGNVNVSKFKGIIPGCGGFIDITHKTKKIVFCGTFSSGGAEIEMLNDELKILKEGKFLKFVDQVEQVTLNGMQALKRGQKVLYITERAVFELTAEGLSIAEITKGVDLEKDIIKLIPFKVNVSENLETNPLT